MIDDDEERARVAEALGAVVDRISARHATRKTQEPAITAKIGQALEDFDGMYADIADGLEETLRNGRFPRSKLQVLVSVQDIPDRGPGALEKRSGVDLYVNITVRQDGRETSKGLLVQAKKGAHRDDLAEQCGKMTDRSEASYAWVYEPEGCRVIDAQAVLDAPGAPIGELPSRRPREVFDAVLECSEGDPGIGLEPDEDEASGLARILRQLEAPRGLSFEVTTPPSEEGSPP